MHGLSKFKSDCIEFLTGAVPAVPICVSTGAGVALMMWAYDYLVGLGVEKWIAGIACVSVEVGKIYLLWAMTRFFITQRKLYGILVAMVLISISVAVNGAIATRFDAATAPQRSAAAGAAAAAQSNAMIRSNAYADWQKRIDKLNADIKQADEGIEKLKMDNKPTKYEQARVDKLRSDREDAWNKRPAVASVLPDAANAAAYRQAIPEAWHFRYLGAILDVFQAACMAVACIMSRDRKQKREIQTVDVAPKTAVSPGAVQDETYSIILESVRSGVIDASSQRALMRTMRDAGMRVSQDRGAMYHRQLQRDGFAAKTKVKLKAVQ